MNGILNVLKPPGMTSFDVVAYVKRKIGVKAGHAGTLDPLAAGVLPVCVGKATRLIEYMSEMRKAYRCEMLLGIETDTQDATGKVVARREVKTDKERVKEVLYSFKGITEQIPPMYSAVKTGGKKLYQLARKGITVDRKPRKIEIYDIRIVDFNDDSIMFDVECSKGTYIRTLCHDAGVRLGCGAHMTFLLRKSVGHFLLKDSITLEKLDEMGEKCLLPIDEAVKEFDPITLSREHSLLLSNGQTVRLKNHNCRTRFVRVYDESGAFMAIGEINDREGVVKPRKVIFGGTNENSI